MSELRKQMIAAMADVLATDEYPVREPRMTVPELVASYVLDAALDVLLNEENHVLCEAIVRSTVGWKLSDDEAHQAALAVVEALGRIDDSA